MNTPEASPGIRSFLRAVSSGSGVDALLRLGYSYSQVGELSATAINNGWVKIDEGKLAVTKEGTVILTLPRSFIQF